MRKHRTAKAIVYLVVNITNGKRYIGITSRPLARRISEHWYNALQGYGNGAFYRALRKYPKECFEWSVLAYFNSYEEAASEEIRLIRELAPEYNSTKGGDGALGRTLSEDGRRRISRANKGKAHHTIPHSQQTKEKLRVLGLMQREEWLKRSHLGPAASARKVVCLDDGETYDSASAAARHYGVAKSALTELCLGKRFRKSVGGMRFAYVENKVIN